MALLRTESNLHKSARERWDLLLQWNKLYRLVDRGFERDDEAMEKAIEREEEESRDVARVHSAGVGSERGLPKVSSP